MSGKATGLKARIRNLAKQKETYSIKMRLQLTQMSSIKRTG